ncbi:MAG: phosphoribosylaminoimidazolesuccinocarboxamide synthase, partial [Candidatus Bathyarchaeota archaeon]
GEKHDTISKKGAVNATVSAKIFQLLEKNNVPTHFTKLVEPTLMLVHKLNMIPVEVVCRNIAAGHLVKSLPMFKKGDKLKIPLIEFYLKDDALHDPLLVEDHMVALGLAKRNEVNDIRKLTLKVNNILKRFMAKRKLLLVDFKIEFGRDTRGKIRLGDELNIDSMRLWDMATGKNVDKDSYREGLSLEVVEKTYLDSYKRIIGLELK